MVFLMQWASINTNSFTFCNILSVSTYLINLEKGKQIHSFILKIGFELDVFVRSAFIDMYAKCGSLDNAYDVFNKMFKQNLVSWIVIIARYTQHGYVENVLKLFNQM